MCSTTRVKSLNSSIDLTSVKSLINDLPRMMDSTIKIENNSFLDYYDRDTIQLLFHSESLDTHTGTWRQTTNNPNGAAIIMMSGASVVYRPSGWPAYIVVIFMRGGYVRFRFDFRNIFPTSSTACTLRWYIHGTTSGGIVRTAWFVRFNANRYNHNQRMSNNWEHWYWPIPVSEWHWNAYDTVDIGLQDTSAAVLYLWWLKLKVHNVIVRVGIGEEQNSQIESNLDFNLLPNPISNKAITEYILPKKSYVDLKVFDVHGREVAVLVNGKQTAGHHQVTWDIRNIPKKKLPNGVYFCRLKYGTLTDTRKVIICR